MTAILALAARQDEMRASWVESDGTVVKTEDWDPGQPLPQEFAHIGVACTQERQPEVRSLLQPLPEVTRIWSCSWSDAALAGAFAGQPGLLLVSDHRVGADGLALVLARESTHRTLAVAQPEGSLDWLTAEAMTLLETVSDARLKRLLGPWSTPDNERSRRRAHTVSHILDELATYPGPEPATLALLGRAGRRLGDIVRHGLGRSRLGGNARAAWSNGALQGPLWEALASELQRGAAGLRWQEPRGEAAEGCAWLVLGALREEQRQALNPAYVAPQIAPRAIHSLDADAWRQLARWR